jgi:hypothetical protein
VKNLFKTTPHRHKALIVVRALSMASARARSCAKRWRPTRRPRATTRRSWPPRARPSCAPACSACACRAWWVPMAGRFYMVNGDAASVLRCRHGQTTHTLSAQARERQRYAAGLIAAALFGCRVAGKALGGSARPEGSRGTRRVLVRLVVALHATRAARRKGPAGRGGGVWLCAGVCQSACEGHTALVLTRKRPKFTLSLHGSVAMRHTRNRAPLRVSPGTRMDRTDNGRWRGRRCDRGGVGGPRGRAAGLSEGARGRALDNIILSI